MNRKIWTQESAADFALTVKIIKRQYLRWKWMYQSGCFVTILCPVGAFIWASRHEWWLLGGQFLISAFVWYCWADSKRKAAQWRECYHHGLRALVEERERAQWHLVELDRKLDAIWQR
jgi:hypothetical protein